MDLAGDQRAQSVQIGAILLFAALIIAFASYQAFVVPNQNRGVEFNHNQATQSQLQDLRNAIVSVGGNDDEQSVAVQLGTRYPSRLLARNPGPVTGSLQTVGTENDSVGLTIANAQAAGETGDYWNESQRYNTGAIRYEPNYNLYTNAPTTTYENTVLYNRFESGNISVANQSFVDGTDISLVLLNGTMSRSSTEATSVDVRSVSSSTERVRLTDDGSPMTVTFASTRSATYWDFLETTESTVTDVTSTTRSDEFYDVTVQFEQGRTYSLELTKVGVGTGVTDADAAYLTDVDGDGATVSRGDATELTLEVRDRFNNPPDNASAMTVEAAVAPGDSGTLQSSSAVPDEDGQVTFVYEATGSTGTQTINASYGGLGSGFDATTTQNVSMSVDVTAPSGGTGGGGGAYSLAWADPSGDNPNAALSDCSAAGCTWDVGGSSDSNLTLRAGTLPPLDGFETEFAVNNTTVGTVSPVDASTDSNGEATTEINASENGVVGVYAASGGSSDVFNLTVENTSTGGPTNSAPSASFTTSTSGLTVDFDASGSSDSDGDTLSYSWDFADGTTGNGETTSHTYASGGTYTVTLTVSDGNGGSDTATQDVTVGSGPPSITAASFSDSNNTIDNSEANSNVQRTVSLTFNQTMDTSVDPTVAYENVSDGSTYTVVSSQWVGSDTYEQTLEFADNDVDTPVTVEVSGAQNTEGTAMSTERPLSFTVDTLVPASPAEVYIEPASINATNVGSVETTMTNPGTLTGDEVAVITLRNVSTGSRVTVETQITTGGGENTTVTIDATSLPDSIVVANATIRDDAGNRADYVQNDPTTKDTVAPTIRDFRLTNPSGDTVQVTVTASEPLDSATVPVTDEDGTTVQTFDRGTLSETQVGSEYEYTGSFTASQDGNYTATLTFANDSAGNEATTGQSDSTSIGPSESLVSRAGVTADGNAFGTGTLNATISNNGYRNVTIRNITVTTGANKIKSIYETSGGDGAGNREVYVNGTADNGYVESGEDSTGDIKGQTEPLNDQAVVVGQSEATISIAYFRDNNGRTAISGRTVIMTIGFADGSEVQYTYNP